MGLKHIVQSITSHRPGPTPEQPWLPTKKVVLPQEDQELLKKILKVGVLLHHKQLGLDPSKYGLPDLLKAVKAPRAQQESLMREVVSHLLVIPNGPPRHIHLIDEQVRFLVDLFFHHTRFGIIWKPRGGGGSLVIAVLIWLLAVYRRKSCLDLAGCLLPETPIWTQDRGWQAVQNIHLQERVLTRKGFRPVLQTIEKDWDGPVIHLGTSFCPQGIEVTSDHKILVARKGGPQFEEAGDLTLGQMLAAPDAAMGALSQLQNLNSLWLAEEYLFQPLLKNGTRIYRGKVWDLSIEDAHEFLTPVGIVHNSGEQARAVYNYTKGFWEGLPELKRALVLEAPMKNETVLRNGATIKCTPASERQVKSKHSPVLVLDEACQKQAAVDAVFMDAIQGVFSEPDPVIVMNSTFYYPQGLFQSYWDQAEAKGFRRYKWSIFSVMRRCDRQDCFSGCPLSWEEDVLDLSGKATGIKQWVGCCGLAHDSKGFLTREQVIEAKRINEGSGVFEVQMMGRRPSWMDSVYPVAAIDACVVRAPTVDLKKSEFAVGIDWGLIGQTCVCLLALDRERVCTVNGKDQPIKGKVAIIHAEFMTGKLTGEVIAIVLAWIERYGGQPVIFADGSHPYNNLEMERAGLEVVPVYFVKWKETLIGNVRKYLTNQRLEIPDTETLLLSQLKRYARTPSGKPKKQDDHGPDGLGCGLLAFPFLELFGEKAELEAQDRDQVILI